GEGRSAARRDRLLDLFGPARGWLLPGRYLSGRSHAALARRSTGQCDGYAALSRRPPDTRMGLRARRKEVAAGRSKIVDENSGAAALLWRCRPHSSTTHGAACAGIVARLASVYVSHRPWRHESPREDGL